MAIIAPQIKQLTPKVFTPANLVWTGTTAPSGATFHRIAWTQIGQTVVGYIWLEWATNGSSLTQVDFDLPLDMPVPSSLGLTVGANERLHWEGCLFKFSRTDAGSIGRSFIARDSGNTKWIVTGNSGSGSHRIAMINICYVAA